GADSGNQRGWCGQLQTGHRGDRELQGDAQPEADRGSSARLVRGRKVTARIFVPAKCCRIGLFILDTLFRFTRSLAADPEASTGAATDRSSCERSESAEPATEWRAKITSPEPPCDSTSWGYGSGASVRLVQDSVRQLRL